MGTGEIIRKGPRLAMMQGGTLFLNLKFTGIAKFIIVRKVVSNAFVLFGNGAQNEVCC